MAVDYALRIAGATTCNAMRSRFSVLAIFTDSIRLCCMQVDHTNRPPYWTPVARSHGVTPLSQIPVQAAGDGPDPANTAPEVVRDLSGHDAAQQRLRLAVPLPPDPEAPTGATVDIYA